MVEMVKMDKTIEMVGMGAPISTTPGGRRVVKMVKMGGMDLE